MISSASSMTLRNQEKILDRSSLPLTAGAVPGDSNDIEASAAADAAEQGKHVQVTDIEHEYVDDDPRLWSARKKYFCFFFVCYAAMAAATSANIFLPAIEDLQRDLGASQAVVNLSVSLFVLFQGTVPILWSAISEIYGRKIVYVIAYAIFTASQLACALSTNQAIFLAFRVIGACGSSAGLTIGGGTLADIYDTHERGTRIGVYYLFPLLGPSLGTLLGGVLTLTKPGWRAAFWFMTAYGASVTLWAFFFHDTFRKERSLAWRKAINRAQQHAEAKNTARSAARLAGNSPTSRHHKMPWSKGNTPNATPVQEKAPTHLPASDAKTKFNGGRSLQKITTETGEEVPIKVHLTDINPLSATGTVLKRPSNLLVIVASGLLFGGQYSLTFTGALSFAAPPYDYDSLKIGLVLLCFGIGNIIGSICGGRYSDITLRQRRLTHNGINVPEWRLRATLVAMPLVPLSFVAYAWTVDKGVPIAGPCVILFLAGLSSIWVYSAALAYIVDSSVGMASSAVSANSLSRGVFGFIASEVAEPLLTSIGNGWLYTIWTILNILALGMIVAVCFKGRRWRERAPQRHVEKEEAKQAQAQTGNQAR